MRRIIVGTIVPLLVASAGCTHRGGYLPGSLNPVAAASQAQPASPTSTSTAVSRKVVARKEDPSTLIAQDRTRCAVPATKYRDSAVGDNVWCDWRSDNRAP